jgi:hypothetical protein
MTMNANKVLASMLPIKLRDIGPGELTSTGCALKTQPHLARIELQYGDC